MNHRFTRILIPVLLGSSAVATEALAPASNSSGQYARIAVLRPHDGDTIDFEAGYIRHLEWHRQAADPWVWYGWTLWASERQRSLVYATFGHSAESLSNPVSPAEDERDNISNVTPHASYMGNAVYEFLPRLSRGTGVPTPTPRVELTTVEVAQGEQDRFEAALRSRQPTLQGETLWFRLAVGGRTPLYVRLRPRFNLTEILDSRDEAALPAAAEAIVTEQTVEILSLRPTLSYGLTPAQP